MRVENRLKRRLAAGERIAAAWIDFASPAVAEVMVHAGWPTVILDFEHGPGDQDTLAHLLRAVQAAGGDAILRVPWGDPVTLKRVLDLGAYSIMVPMVETADQARDVVAACRYPPGGWRGYAADNVRASGYGADPDYAARANDELLLILQIESAPAVAALDGIAAVDGADMLFVGRYDMAGSIGRLGRPQDPEALALLAAAEARITASGKWMATVPTPDDTPISLYRRGYHLLAAASDVALLRDGAKALAAEWADAVAGASTGNHGVGTTG